MLDLKSIRQDPEPLRTALKNRNYDMAQLDALLAEDKHWRERKQKWEEKCSERNKLSLEISKLKKDGKKFEHIIAKSKGIDAEVKAAEEAVVEIEDKLKALVMGLPNIPDKSVPVGKDETANPVVRTRGKPSKTSKQALPHDEAGMKLGWLDFERGVKLAGHRFVVLHGLGAKLERAILNFMLDHNTGKGYKEVFPPLLVNTPTMTGTGQLPKFADELYHCEKDDLWLIPTAEVPVTNLYANEILEEYDLPKYHTAYTPCFRREAGAYGKDIKGIIRQHQFNKVELVKFCLPENSFDELEGMVRDAESILQKLEMPYRVIQLCTGDIGFASAKTYDIEVWMPSQDKYREISSCSNCLDFQSRRANIRFRRKGKLEFVHTLNGSGLAVGRTMVAILENYQDENGITIPKVLRDFMKMDRIEFEDLIKKK